MSNTYPMRAKFAAGAMCVLGSLGLTGCVNADWFAYSPPPGPTEGIPPGPHPTPTVDHERESAERSLQNDALALARSILDAADDPASLTEPDGLTTISNSHELRTRNLVGTDFPELTISYDPAGRIITLRSMDPYVPENSFSEAVMSEVEVQFTPGYEQNRLDELAAAGQAATVDDFRTVLSGSDIDLYYAEATTAIPPVSAWVQANADGSYTHSHTSGEGQAPSATPTAKPTQLNNVAESLLDIYDRQQDGLN